MTVTLEKPTPSTRAGDATKTARLAGPVVFTLVFAAASTWYGSFSYRGHRYFTLFDDAMISMRYATNLAHGHGLVWNVGGAHVEGYTNFLWTLWMALLHLVGLSAASVSLLVVLSEVALLIANLWLVRALATEMAPGRPQVATVAVWLTATCYPLLYWALRGMEVGLVVALTTAMALVTLRWRANPSPRHVLVLGGLGAVAVLTRTDAIVPAGAAAVFAIAWAPRRSRLRTALTLAGLIGGTLVAHTLFRSLYYSDPLPNTYYLKLGGAPLGARLQRGLESVGALACASLLPALALAGLHLKRGWRVDQRLWLLVALFALPTAYSVYVGGDAWEWLQYANRYIATGLPLLIVVAALGIDDVVRSPAGARTRLAWAGAGLLIVGLLVAVTGAIPTGTLQYSLASTGDVPLRLLLVATAVIIVILWIVRSARTAAVGSGLLVLAAAVVMSGQGLVTWSATAGLHVRDDDTMAIYGLELRQATTPQAVIAVVWAGAGPYFDQRPAVDLLGKSDPHVAKEPMRPGTFYPGHTKWDYGWSIGHLQPDLVAGLVRPTATDLANLRTWGYDELRPGVWVRTTSTNVDRALLVRLIASTPRVGKLIDHDL